MPLDGRYCGSWPPSTPVGAGPQPGPGPVEVEWLHPPHRPAGRARPHRRREGAVARHCRRVRRRGDRGYGRTERVTQHDVKGSSISQGAAPRRSPPADEDRPGRAGSTSAAPARTSTTRPTPSRVQGAVEDVCGSRATALVENRNDGQRRAIVALSPHPRQPATPTTMMGGTRVLTWRLQRQPAAGMRMPSSSASLNGATGTYGAHLAAVPGSTISESFVEGPGPDLEPLTTRSRATTGRGEF